MERKIAVLLTLAEIYEIEHYFNRKADRLHDRIAKLQCKARLSRDVAMRCFNARLDAPR